MGFWLPERIAFSWGNEIMFSGMCVCARAACVCVYEYFTLAYAQDLPESETLETRKFSN